MSEIDQLRESNAKLREENAHLKKRLEQERMHLTTDALDDGHRQLEVESYKGLIREQDGKATILALHDELTRLGRQCTVYAEALEEARGNFVEMKRLYSELNSLIAGCSTINQE